MVNERELFKNREDQAGFSKALEALPKKITLNIMVAELNEDNARERNIHPQKSHRRPDRESGK